MDITLKTFLLQKFHVMIVALNVPVVNLVMFKMPPTNEMGVNSALLEDIQMMKQSM